jgi:hypothetical protein
MTREANASLAIGQTSKIWTITSTAYDIVPTDEILMRATSNDEHEVESQRRLRHSNGIVRHPHWCILPMASGRLYETLIYEI